MTLMPFLRVNDIINITDLFTIRNEKVYQTTKKMLRFYWNTVIA